MKVSALETALNNELRERQFYLDQANQAESELAKKMFLELGREEEQHYNALKLIFQRREEKGLPKEIDLSGKSAVRNVLLNFLRKKSTQIGAAKDELDAMKTAIAFEEKGVVFYQGLAKEASDEKEKAFFELMASMEREHLISLRDSLEYLQDPEGYFRSHERSSLDGA